MKQYVIDELRHNDLEKIKNYFKANSKLSSIDVIYWVFLPDDILTDLQKGHVECQSYYFAVNIEKNYLSCELLVRSEKVMRCSCIGYATKQQYDWIIEYLDLILLKLNISV